MGDNPSAAAKWSKYSIEDGKLTRKQEFCPKCGPGVFMGVHADRKTCGRCGYSEKNE
jgi:small subunit ribosomal protein S27Ae